MAVEDFTTYTEVDEETDITVTSTKIDVDTCDTRGATSYVYKDKGAAYFSGDFEHKFEGYLSDSTSTGPLFVMWMVSNIVGDFYDVISTSTDGVAAYWYESGGTDYIYIRIIENGSIIASDSWSSPSLSTLYYFRLTRDDDGGANNTGQYTLVIATGNYDDDGGSVQDTLTVDSSVGEQNDFRYIYGFATYDTGGSASNTGYVQNLDLDPAAATVTYTSYGDIFLYTSANWTSPTVYLETYMKATSGTMYARLYDITAASAVTDSEITTASATLARCRSSALTLTDAHEYRIQYGGDFGDVGTFLGGKLILKM